MTPEHEQVLNEIASKRTFRMIDGLSIRFVESERRHDDALLLSPFEFVLAGRAPSNAVLVTYPDSGHGSLFQFHESFTRQAAAFLASDSPCAPY
jgi:hypothetical protein